MARMERDLYLKCAHGFECRDFGVVWYVDLLLLSVVFGLSVRFSPLLNSQRGGGV